MTIHTIDYIKELQTEFRDIGNLTQDVKLKTRYLVIASNLTSLINYLDSESEGRYE